MNPPQDPRQDPNQDDEAALARVLRALPGGEPSPRVDAAILAAARNATAGSPARTHRRRGLPGWALGTAAAAVLAVGIGLQLQPAREALPEGIPAQAPAGSMADAAPDTAEESAVEGAMLESIEVTGSRLRREEAVHAEITSPSAKPQAPAPAAALAPPEPEADVAAPPPPAPPAPPAAQAPAREARAEAARTLESQAADRQQSAAPALPSAFSADAVLPPVDEDARLAPEAWLERIRERIRQGDRGGASASLQRFQRAHPDLTLPPDLAAFRP